MIEGIADGTIDAIATDHAPHAFHEKQVEFERAAFGITGLETALAIAVTVLHQHFKLPLWRIVELLSSNPARIFGLSGRGSLAPGSHADVTIFDPKKKWTFDASQSKSKSKNTPYDGWSFTGKVVATIVDGKVVYQTDELRRVTNKLSLRGATAHSLKSGRQSAVRDADPRTN